MNSPLLSIRSPRSLGAVLAALSVASLIGCGELPAGSVARPTGIGNPPVLVAAQSSITTTTTTTTTTPTPPSTNASAPQVADGRIQRIEVKGAQPATFITKPGKNLTVVASSAASTTATPPSFRLIVGPDAGTSVASAYGLLSQAGEAPEMPFRPGFTASTQGLLDAKPAVSGGKRRLALVGDRALGSEDLFWINTGDSRASGDRQQTARLARITDHAYIYVDKVARELTDAQLDRLASEFETKIFPNETQVFGLPPQPGVDGESRVFIVISPATDNWGKEKGLMGYFWSRDAIPGTSQGSHSNQKEVLFMTDALFNYPALTSFGTLAHEFQHLLNFSQKAVRSGYTLAEETWLDEGLSMYAMEVAGYGLPAGDKLIAKDLNEFQQNPAAYSLTDWSSNPHGFAYGQSYLFVRYLVDRYGKDIIKDILASNKSGEFAVAEALAKRNETFANFFGAWAITNLISDTTLSADTVYRYSNLNLAADYGGFKLNGFKTTAVSAADTAVNLRPWGTTYLSYASETERAWTLNLADAASARLLGAAIVR